MNKNGNKIITESHEANTVLELFEDTSKPNVAGIYKRPGSKPKVKKFDDGLGEDGQPVKHGKDTYNINEIMRRNYQSLNLGEYYTSLMGVPEPKFVGMFYGQPGGGKSVFAIQFADYLAKHHGKVYYNSHEERIKRTLRMRIEEFDINATKRLQFGDAVPFNRMMDKIQSNHYRFIFIDSVQYMQFTFDQLQEMSHHFRKRLLSIIMISFGASWGNPDKARELLYASDIKAFFYMEDDYGMAKFASRYKSTIVKTELFQVQEEIIKRKPAELAPVAG